MMACIKCFILTSVANLYCTVNAFYGATTSVLATRAAGVKYSACQSFVRIFVERSSRNADNIPEDEEILRDFHEIKRQMYGADIPLDDEIKQATLNSENAFLAAMLEQTQQFHQIKSEQGSDRAVEVFMNRIQEEQNPCGESEKGEGVIAEDYTAKERFAERILKEQNPGIARDETDGWR